MQQGAFMDGRQHGLWRRWHDNGNVLDEGTYERGKKAGEWVTYGRDGKESQRTHHR
ncbi:toxin-antitoxin system YwqK family antitoxin [Streptomyces sp. NPDC001970]